MERVKVKSVSRFWRRGNLAFCYWLGSGLTEFPRSITNRRGGFSKVFWRVYKHSPAPPLAPWLAMAGALAKTK